MKRIFILLASLLVVGNVYGSSWRLNSGFGWDSFDFVTYKVGCSQAGCVLISDDDDRWFFFVSSSNGIYSESVRARAIFQCQIKSKTPSTCQVVDENLQSDFIKNHISQAPRSTPSPSPDGDRQLLSTGTGFLINKNFIATADHVLRMNDRGDVCNSVSIMYRHDEYQTTIADLDPANDIGLLKLSKPISFSAKIRNDPDLRLGETAINYGFPLSGELSTSAKITSGAVNSLAGYNNNSAFIQYDAASQFGNSGGPVLDASGNVIGVVSAKLDDADNQLVNFATKSTILEGFLKANKVPFEKADLGDKLELPEIAEKAENFTVLVGCWE